MTTTHILFWAMLLAAFIQGIRGDRDGVQFFVTMAVLVCVAPKKYRG